jgi:hypothetical protein
MLSYKEDNLAAVEIEISDRVLVDPYEAMQRQTIAEIAVRRAAASLGHAHFG